MNDRTDHTTAQAAAPAPQVIESASASTACQTNDSNFAYYLTAGVLGGCLLFTLAVAMLLMALLQSGISASSHTISYTPIAHYEHIEHHLA